MTDCITDTPDPEKIACDRPCDFEHQCSECAEYWQRMIREGFWDEENREWTDKAVKEWEK